MSTKTTSKNVSPDVTMSLKELTILLIRYYGFSEGYFDLLIQFQIGMGAVGPNEEQLVPGAMIGISGVGLKEVKEIGRNTVDAAQVNPPAKGAKKKRPSR